MYLYYDRYGTLKEQIVFNTARVGNSGINKIFVYWESVEDFADWAQELALQARYLLQDNTQYPSATTFQFSAIPVTAELPFDNKQDLKYFSYGKEYKFLTIDIPDNILSFSGAVKAYIWVLNSQQKRILGLGAFAFMVDGNIGEVKQDETITIAQWNMIAAQLGLLSGSVIDVTCDIATNTLKVYYANGTYAIRNLPPNNVQTTVSTDFMKEFFFFANSWEQDGEQGYYLALSSSQVGFTDNKFFVQLEEKGEYNSKQGGFVLSDNIFKGNDGSVLLYSAKPFDGRLLLVGGDLLSGDILVSGLSYDSENSVLSFRVANGDTKYIELHINEKLSRPSDAPESESFVAIKENSDGTTTVRYIPVSTFPTGEYVDLTSAQTISGSKTFSAYVIMQNGLWVLGSAAILGAGIQGLLGSPLINVPTSQSGTTYIALAPTIAPTEPSFIVTASDRTPTWKPVSEFVDIQNVVQATGTSETDVMSQKAVTYELNRRTITGAGAPTTSTIGTVGLIYEDMTNGKLYQCTAINSGVYTWVELLQDKPYELIEEITLTEDTSAIERTTEPDGTLYNFKKLKIFIDSNGNTLSGTGWLQIETQDYYSTYYELKDLAVYESYSLCIATIEANNNMWDGRMSLGRNSNYATDIETTYRYKSSLSLHLYNNKNINRVRLYGMIFVTGIKIKIYGVRA